MRFLSVMLGLLCLPALMLAIVLSPALAVIFYALALIPGFSAFTKKTSSRRTWNIASFHSPHSLTWRWLLAVGFSDRMVNRPYAKLNEYGFMYGLGIISVHVYRYDDGPWQFAGSILGIWLHLNRQKPMWFRDMYQRARDEADQLSGRAWFSDRHPNKVHVPPSPNTPTPSAIQ